MTPSDARQVLLMETVWAAPDFSICTRLFALAVCDATEPPVMGFLVYYKRS